MHRETIRRVKWGMLVVGLVATMNGVAAGAALAATAAGGNGTVYAMTNEAAGNQVVIYARAGDGTLTEAATVSTGGLGTGAGLGSQGALVHSSDGAWLFAVNAGSNDVSAFSVQRGGGLSLVNVVSSGGTTPISLTAHGRFLYALDAGSDTITGFTISAGGLASLAGSTRPLSGTGVAPAQVQFSPNGDLLVVTEKATNLIDTYTVGTDGRARGPRVHPSEGTTPFGFAFHARHLIVSEAFGGGGGASALSSYSVSSAGALHPVSVSVPDTQTAACWVVVTRNGRFGYTTNTGSSDVSSYSIAPNGSLRLLAAVAGATGGGPTDAAFSHGSQFLYVLNSADGTLTGFQVRANGSLLAIAGAGGLPAGAATGVAAR